MLLLHWPFGKDTRSNFQYPELDSNLDGPELTISVPAAVGYVVTKAINDAEFDTHQRDDELA